MKTDKRIKFLSNIINSRDIVPQFEPSFENRHIVEFLYETLLSHKRRKFGTILCSRRITFFILRYFNQSFVN